MNSDSYDFNTISLAQTVYQDQNEKVKVKYERIEDVPKEVRIPLNENTTFRFSCDVEGDFFVIRLSEIGILCPFIYTEKLTLEQIREKSAAFKSCDLPKVKEHIDKLFSQGNISLTREDDDSITLNISLHDISQTVGIKIDSHKKMTTEKNETLLNLYEKEKKDINVIKEIEK